LRVWRLARRRHAALDGEGARRLGGRWNSRGQPAVYASQHLSLAVLEIIVHLELSPDEFPEDYVKIAIELPDSVSIRRVAALPRGDAAMRELGSRWMEERSTVALMVPSVVVPEELNVLLNPLHPEFVQIRAAAPRQFRFDPRLLS
jgi:RES domain-containing protein